MRTINPSMRRCICRCVMDQRWMYGTRPSVEYLNGVNGFINVAKQQANNEEIDAYGLSFIYGVHVKIARMRRSSGPMTLCFNI